jgi:NitT/TauT family transport system substrate-binding protein
MTWGPLRQLASVLLPAMLLAFASPVAAAEVVKMGDLPVISNAGLYIAIEKGYFAERGITVETERFASGAKMIAPLSTGQIDVATGSPSAGLFNSVASGMDFRIVADKGQIRPKFSFTGGLLVRKDLIDSGRVKSIKDLKGMKIASGAKGIVLDYILAKTLESEGVPFDAVEIVYLSYPDGLKALASKAVDAAVAPEPWGVQAQKQGVATRLFLSENVPSIATFQIGVVMYSGKFIKERPRVARDFMQAYVKGVKLYNEKGLKDADVAAMVSKHTSVAAETVRATIPFYADPAARPRTQDLATLQDWFHQLGWVKTKAPIDKLVDLSFLE